MVNTDGLKIACVYSWNCTTAKNLKVSEILYNFARLENPTQKATSLVKEILMRLAPYKDYCAIAKFHELGNEAAFDYMTVAPY